MKKQNNKLWKELYKSIYDFDKKEFSRICETIIENYLCKDEYEEILFKAGDSCLEIFKDPQKALHYYEIYLKEFKKDGSFSKQISERIDYIKKLL